MDLLTYYSDLAVAYPEYITQKQFCEVCGICHKTAYNLTRRGEISYEIVDTPTGRIHHIKLTDALAYLYKKDTLYGNDENVNRQIYEVLQAHFSYLPYYYGHSGEQYAFFRIPKLLITDSRFDGVSSDAKLLYGLLLDRMELSYRNGWVDDQNRVFIIFTVEEVMETLRCRSEKAVRLFAELDSKKGIGLIERKRQGLGKPAIIYVKNFAGDIS